MKTRNRKYRSLVSSDWNECLAPAGPFDCVTFTYPSLGSEVNAVFKAYTGNRIPLSEAVRRVTGLLPAAITEDKMDAYLEDRFETYRGVLELIEWCRKQDILFMINTTGMQGYFQRAFKKGLLPEVTVVSAHPVIKYQEEGNAVCQWYDLLEINDKPVNTQRVMRAWGIPANRVILIGDSGGDGPQFEWGAAIGAFLIGSMTKWSLDRYCQSKGLNLYARIGARYSEGENRNPEAEMKIDLTDLIPSIKAILSVSCQKDHLPPCV